MRVVFAVEGTAGLITREDLQAAGRAGCKAPLEEHAGRRRASQHELAMHVAAAGQAMAFIFRTRSGRVTFPPRNPSASSSASSWFRFQLVQRHVQQTCADMQAHQRAQGQHLRQAVWQVVAAVDAQGLERAAEDRQGCLLVAFVAGVAKVQRAQARQACHLRDKGRMASVLSPGACSMRRLARASQAVCASRLSRLE